MSKDPKVLLAQLNKEVRGPMRQSVIVGLLDAMTTKSVKVEVARAPARAPVSRNARDTVAA